MRSTNGPVIVRPAVAVKSSDRPYLIKPGLHSHNTTRRLRNPSAILAVLSRLRIFLFVLGMCGIGYYCYTLSDQYIYQAYQNWAFDQQIAGHPAVTFADYLREKTPFGFLAGPETVRPTAQAPNLKPPSSLEIPSPATGSLLGRVSIQRLNLSAIVREGTDADTLKLAVGHVPSTALPGQSGNFAIAAHRDTLFRALKDIKKGDVVTFQSASGTYSYQVFSTKIVKPSDISVLQPDGGGVTPLADSTSEVSGGGEKLLTMITCYPFYYVGSAPKRFIVQAQMISSDPESAAPVREELNPSPPAPIPATRRPPRNTRRSSHSTVSRRSASPDTSHQPSRKRNFWHKLFHAG